MLTVDTPLLFLRSVFFPVAPFCVSLRFLPFIFRMTFVSILALSFRESWLKSGRPYHFDLIRTN
jgi:hypothetical protein